MSVISRLVALPVQVRPGESVELWAYGEFDRPMSDNGPLTVTINGQPGAHQFFQFQLLGSAVLHAAASDGSGRVVGRASTTVFIDDLPHPLNIDGRTVLPTLAVAADPSQPYRFRFCIGEPIEHASPMWTATDPATADRTYRWRVGTTTKVTSVPWLECDLRDVSRNQSLRTVDLTCRIDPEDITVTRTLSVDSNSALADQRRRHVRHRAE